MQADNYCAKISESMMCDASERQPEQLLVAPAWKTQLQEKVKGAKATGSHAHGATIAFAPAPTSGGTRRLWEVVTLLKAAGRGRQVACGQENNWL